MAVVTKYGSGARDPASLKAIDGINAAGELRKIYSKVTITNGDSIASKYMLGEAPADAILMPGSLIWYGGVTSVVSADIGVNYPNGGAVILDDCIVNGHDIHLAGSTTLAAATGSGVATPANQAKKLWELAGLATNPGGNLALWLTIDQAATATADVLADITYVKGA